MSNTAQLEPHLTPAEAAAIAGLSARSIHRATRLFRDSQGAQGLRFRKLGHRTVIIPESALAAWLARGDIFPEASHS